MKNKISVAVVAGAMAVFGGLVAAGISAAPVLADETGGLSESGKLASAMTISPMNEKILLSPGETYNGSITVSNPASSIGDLKYSVSVGSFAIKSDDQNKRSSVDTDTETGYNQMMDWITLDRDGGEVAPNSSQIVTYTINVPKDAPGGGQFASLIFKNDSLDSGSSSGVSIQSNVQIASLIYATVVGETNRAAEIVSNDIPGFLTAGPIKTESVVQNDGSVFEDATYTLQVWPLFSDEEICTNEEEPGGEVVLPGAKEYRTETCDKVGMVGIYKVKQTVKIAGETSEMQRMVLICPIWLILVVALILIVIIGAIVYIIRKHSHKR